MILQGMNNEYIHTSFNSVEEADLYYSLRDYLNKANIEFNIQILHRYCKLQFEFLKLLQKKPGNYMLDKYATHLQQLEESLCLTPKSMLAYKKDTVLMEAKKSKSKRTNK